MRPQSWLTKDRQLARSPLTRETFLRGLCALSPTRRPRSLHHSLLHVLPSSCPVEVFFFFSFSYSVPLAVLWVIDSKHTLQFLQWSDLYGKCPENNQIILGWERQPHPDTPSVLFCWRSSSFISSYIKIRSYCFNFEMWDKVWGMPRTLCVYDIYTVAEAFLKYTTMP